jgi:hypothetical protein
MSGVDDAYTKLLIHCNGGNNSTTFTDEAGHSCSAAGSAKQSSTQVMFSSASSYYSASAATTYLSVADSTDWILTEDWSFDCWVYLASVTQNLTLFAQVGGGKYQALDFTSGGTLLFYDWNGSSQINSWNCTHGMSINTWTHIFIGRATNTPYMAIGGTQKTVTASKVGTHFDVASVLGIGGYNYGFNGYIDEVRLSKGICRWTSNFTPPTAEYAPAATGVSIPVLMNIYKQSWGY